MKHNPYQPTTAVVCLATESARSLPVLFGRAVGIPLAAELAALLATGTFGRFMWLLPQAASLLVVAWPLSVPLAIWAVYALRTASDAGELNSRGLLWLAPLVVLPMTMLVWGALFAHPRGDGYVRWQLLVVHWAFFASIAIGTLAVLFNRGRRALVAPTVILLLLFSFSCSFTAGSSVTGDWI